MRPTICKGQVLTGWMGWHNGLNPSLAQPKSAHLDMAHDQPLPQETKAKAERLLSVSEPWLWKLTPLETQTPSTPTCSPKPDKLATRWSSFSSSLLHCAHALLLFHVCCLTFFFWWTKFRLAMPSIRVWKRNPTRHPRRSLLWGCYTRPTAKDRGPSLWSTAGLLG